MDLRVLRYFCAVVHEGHFGRAAARLGIAQPPLTRQIQKLERDLDVLLLHRMQKRFEVTQAGQLLYERALRLLDSADQAQADVRRASSGEMGRFTVGFVNSTAFTILPAVISKFRQAFPDVQLEVREMYYNTLLSALEGGGVDVGLLRPHINSRVLQIVTLIREPFVALVPFGHRLAGQRTTSLRQLANEPFVMFSRTGSPLLHMHVMQMCLRAGFTPKTIQLADQIHTVAGFVGAGMGVAIAPSTVTSFNFPGLRCLQITDRIEPLPMAMAWRQGKDTVLIRNFAKLARAAGTAWRPTVPPS